MSTTPTNPSSNPNPQSNTNSTKKTTFNIGTRKSALALKQTDLVLTAATQSCPDYTFVVKARDTAAGDIDKVTPFKDMVVKNIWTHELEMGLREGGLDFLVHSLKDVPTVLPLNCEIGATLPRSDPRDALIIKPHHPSGATRIQDLPAGSIIGTSSIRRTAQIALKHPHLIVKDLRGNIDTRLRKLDDKDGVFDAIILASAGLIRMGLEGRISQFLSGRVEDGGMLYAVGQGAIGVENRCDDEVVRGIMGRVNHSKTFFETSAERSLLRTIEGGCSAPLGVESEWVEKEELRLRAVVVSLDGKHAVEADVSAVVKNVEDAEKLGQDVAAQVLGRGADKILAEIKAKRPTTATDLEEN